MTMGSSLSPPPLTRYVATGGESRERGSDVLSWSASKIKSTATSKRSKLILVSGGLLTLHKRSGLLNYASADNYVISSGFIVICITRNQRTYCAYSVVGPLSVLNPHTSFPFGIMVTEDRKCWPFV